MSVLNRTNAHLARIAERDGDIKAFIRVDTEDARAAARAADARAAANAPLSPLDGMLVAVKDNLAVAEKPWTAGIHGRRGLIADEDAAVVSKLRAAGAIIVGGANMEEAALGAVTDNPTFGRCVNPLGEGLTPGGSSGGSAAALAAGFVDLALGTDTMGSIRVPASYCGLHGFKPSFDAIDREGLALLCPSLDTIGPMARDVRQLAPAFRALCRPGFADARASGDGLARLRIGVPVQLQDVDIERPVWDGLKIARRALFRLGADVFDVDLPDWRPGKARRAGLLVTEAEGARELRDLIDAPGAISPHLQGMLDYGRRAPKEKIAAAYGEIERAARSVETAFETVDAILTPTTPQRAFSHGEPIPPNQADLTALANFAGCPAIALPVQPNENLPASVQLMAARGRDWSLLEWAEALAEEIT